MAAPALILRPIVLSSRPVEEAVTRGVSVYTRKLLCHDRVLPMMPYNAQVSSTILVYAVLRAYLPHAADNTT